MRGKLLKFIKISFFVGVLAFLAATVFERLYPKKIYCWLNPELCVVHRPVVNTCLGNVSLASSKPNPVDMAKGLFDQTNEARKNPLKWNDCLAEKAIERAEYISKTKELSHTDLNGEIPYEKLAEKCFPKYRHIGENLTEGFYDSERAFQALMDSPTHKANILGNFTHIGIGCFDMYCVQLFAK